MDNNEYLIERGLRFVDDTCYLDLYYPDVPKNKIKNIEIGLVDVRAADSIRISYDKERDGWVIKQASTFSWSDGDEKCDMDWQEVAFIQAWAREKTEPI